MKKYLPIIIFAVGLIVVGAVAFFVFRGKGAVVDEEENVPPVPFEMRPVASLTPSEDGHWLKLKIEKLVFSAASVDYELLYKLPDGRTQGVPGTVKLEGQEAIERDLLLGSESSGKFRYDEGVEEGTLTLRFRNEKGKLVGKLSNDFHLQRGTKDLSSIDGGFKYLLKKTSDAFFVVMDTFGVPSDLPGSLASVPYGVFTSSEDKVPGKVEFGSAELYEWDGSTWQKLEDGEASNVGIFVSIGE
jgi:hypothetical protein